MPANDPTPAPPPSPPAPQPERRTAGGAEYVAGKAGDLPAWLLDRPAGEARGKLFKCVCGGYPTAAVEPAHPTPGHARTLYRSLYGIAFGAVDAAAL